MKTKTIQQLNSFQNKCIGIWIVISIVLSTSMVGQNEVLLRFNDPSVKEIFESENILFDTIFPSKKILEISMHRMVNELKFRGYIEANIDHLSLNETLTTVDIHIGEKYRWASVTADELDEELKLILTNELRYASISLPEIGQLHHSILKKLSESGYPMAEISYDNLHIIEDQIHSKLVIQKHEKIVFDSLIITQKSNLSNSFLKNYLDIFPGDVYDERKIYSAKKKLEKLSYVLLKSPPKLKFSKGKASLLLPIETKASSRFDFLIGLLPNTIDGRQNLTLAVDFNLEMSNKLGLGEYTKIVFRRLRPENQQLELAAKYPYPFQIPFSIDGSFSLYRNADNFLELSSRIGAEYEDDKHNFFQFYWQNSSSRLLEIDTLSLLSTGNLPEELDVRYNGLGLNWRHVNLNYIFNPSSGTSLSIGGVAGFKSILPNFEILDLKNENIDFSTSYDSLNLRTSQFKLSGDFSYFLPVSRRTTILTKLKMESILSSGPLFKNELIRLGGSQLLRGFDEQSILADSYGLVTMEYRLLLDKNSYIGIFSDYARLRNSTISSSWSSAFSGGATMSFETAAGIFAISAAVGSMGDFSFSFREAKVHFGFLSIF